MNLRGLIVPIVDLRIYLKLGAATCDAKTVVIILNVVGHVIGIVVYSVSDVVSLQPYQSRQAPNIGGGEANYFNKEIA